MEAQTLEPVAIFVEADFAIKGNLMSRAREDKDDRINELTDELEASEAEVRKLKDERIELVKDARAAKDLRD
ncbi:hypothetical protein TELCIR_22811, partial [Teladorsagia circumcincta]